MRRSVSYFPTGSCLRPPRQVPPRLVVRRTGALASACAQHAQGLRRMAARVRARVRARVSLASFLPASFLPASSFLLPASFLPQLLLLLLLLLPINNLIYPFPNDVTYRFGWRNSDKYYSTDENFIENEKGKIKDYKLIILYGTYMYNKNIPECSILNIFLNYQK